MKKIRVRATSLMLLCLMVIFGMMVYILRYIDDGGAWAMYFSSVNSESSGKLVDRNDIVLASFTGSDQRFSEDELTRIANYHVTGDYWGRTGSGLISDFASELQGFNLISGTTKAQHTTLKLSIDSELNKLAYQAMGEERTGAVLMCNYKTGEIICLMSSPGIDPAASEIEPKEGAYINRCLSAAFTPGSVFKLITAAAAIENLDVYNMSFYCEGVYTIAGVDIKCAGVHYTQNFEEAMSNSCNCAFAQIAVKLGQDTMIKYVQDYGFLDSHSVDGIETAVGSYPLDFVGDPELAWSGIGQSTDLICPYSMLRLVSAIANGGVLTEHSLVLDDEPVDSVRIMPEDTADKLKQLMSYAAYTHYDRENNFPGLEICAKTGTAELGDGTSHAWFTGFLEDEEHPYAFVVLVERGGGGLSNAGVLANTLLQEAVSK